METNEFNIRDYMTALRRRSRLLVGVAGAILIVSVFFAVLLPAVYSSRAVILIERQEIPSDLVRSTVTSFADQRIQVISQRVMTSVHLIEIIDKYDLYADLREREPREVILATMREDVNREMISADVVDPRSGRPTEATIAFSLSFTSKSPRLAQRVANELVSLFLNENIKNRTEAAAETSLFLTQEAEKMRERVSGLESNLAAFKAKNVNNRPELEQAVRGTLNRTELELAEVDRRIHSAGQQRIFLEAELARVEPFRTVETRGVVTPTEQLRSVETQLTAAEAAYGDQHPVALRAEADPAAARKIYEKQLDESRHKLGDLSEKYGPEHPDVQVAQRSVDKLESKLAALPDIAEDEIPNNPAYIAINARVVSVDAEISSMHTKADFLRNKMEELTTSLFQIPAVEAEYRAITREYETAHRRYQEIVSKQMEAKLSENPESERKGEKFTLIEPALLPERPTSPNRLMILVVGLLLGASGGFGSVAAAEALDNKVRGRQGIQEILTTPPLACIPYVPGDERIATEGRKLFAWGAAGVLFVAVALIVIHFSYKPLDVLWFVLLRRAGI